MNQVVNATVISNFAAIQRLDLLQTTLGQLYLPIEVYQEIQEGFTNRGIPKKTTTNAENNECLCAGQTFVVFCIRCYPLRPAPAQLTIHPSPFAL